MAIKEEEDFRGRQRKVAITSSDADAFMKARRDEREIIEKDQEEKARSEGRDLEKDRQVAARSEQLAAASQQQQQDAALQQQQEAAQKQQQESQGQGR